MTLYVVLLKRQKAQWEIYECTYVHPCMYVTCIYVIYMLYQHAIQVLTNLLA